MARLDGAEFRARIRAAIGEPDAAGDLDLQAITRRRRSRALPGPGDLPGPLRFPALAALVAAVVAAVAVGAVVGLRDRTPTARVPASQQPSPLPAPSIAAFIPADVTAIGADEWWVAGRETSGCSGAGCSRILWTRDAGKSFTPIPAPPIAITHLRFAINARDGWAYDGVAPALWVTHDGGDTWSMRAFPGLVTGLETSGGFVYAIVCPKATSGCLLERSADGDDSWAPLPLPPGSGRLRDVNAYGAEVWVLADQGGSTATRVLRSTDDGLRFSATSVCGRTGAGATSLDAVGPADLVWVICAAPGAEHGQAWLSRTGGRSFASMDAPGSVPGLSIAATSTERAVVAGSDLELTTDGGTSFRSVLGTGAHWTLVGFTTTTAGFVLADTKGGDWSLWRTDDGGADWREVSLS